MNTEPHNDNNNQAAPRSALKLPSTDWALADLRRLSESLAPISKEQAFIEALQGKAIFEIGRYQVYSDISDDQTVVFIHNPSGYGEHKYIEASIDGHRFIVAAPTGWTEYHFEIKARIEAAWGSRVDVSGGGYVDLNEDGSLSVYGSSTSFGRGDHELAKAALEAAVRRTGERQKDA